MRVLSVVLLPGCRLCVVCANEQVSGWDNPEVEQRMGVVKDVVHAARSLKAQYELQVRPASQPAT